MKSSQRLAKLRDRIGVRHHATHISQCLVDADTPQPEGGSLPDQLAFVIAQCAQHPIVIRSAAAPRAVDSGAMVREA